jgi:hypothetical protein
MTKHRVNVPNTISDAEYARIQERVRKAAPAFLSSEAARRRVAGAAQYKNRHKN